MPRKKYKHIQCTHVIISRKQIPQQVWPWQCYVVNIVNDKDYYMDWKREKCLFRFSPHFSVRYFGNGVVWFIDIILILTHYQIYHFKYFILFYRLPFCCVDDFFTMQKLFSLVQSHFFFFILLSLTKETVLKNCPSAISKTTLSKFLPGILWFWVSYLSLYSILCLYLCMV